MFCVIVIDEIYPYLLDNLNEAITEHNYFE